MALGAFPLWVRRREMAANIPLGQPAIDCIGQRMHAHIGIGMPLQTAFMRHLHTTEHHMVAGAETMHVIT